jgi:hypothetical protein
VLCTIEKNNESRRLPKPNRDYYQIMKLVKNGTMKSIDKKKIRYKKQALKKPSPGELFSITPGIN